MLMGFANLMMLPLRVEYLANPAYGLELSTGMVAVLVGVIPNVARLVMCPIWGRLFDRMNFFVLRVTLNIGFMLGILSFFTTHSTTGLVGGAILYGISTAGGDVAWSLWVTKFARRGGSPTTCPSIHSSPVSAASSPPSRRFSSRPLSRCPRWAGSPPD
jgi:MFS family permease